MKKSIVCVLILLFLGGMFSISAGGGYVLPEDLQEDFPLDLPATGEVRDARVFALGDAFTAVADDVNALFYNPAGLAYLNNGDLRIGGSAFFDFNSELAVNESDLADDIYAAIGNSDTYDYNSDDEIVYDGGGSLSEEDEDILAEQVIPMMLLHKVVDRMQLLPNVSYAGKNWGVGSSASMTVEPIETEENEMYNEFQITQEMGIIGGMGFDLGPAAVGVNARYFKEISTPFTFDYDPFSNLEGIDEDIMDALSDNGQEEYTLEMGVGGMVTLGSLSLGTYVDNFLNIVVDDSGELAEDNVLDKAWETANVGIAFEPSNRKGSQRRSLINFLAAADLNNIGDNENRVLSLGSEMGLHLGEGEVITMDGRVGYKQYLPGELDEIEEIININQGEITMGMGFKALFFKFDAGVSFPAVMVKHAMEFTENETGPETDEDLVDYFSRYGEHFPKFIISGGLSF